MSSTKPSPSPGRVRLVEGEIAEIWLVRPEQANALDFSMGESLKRAVEALNESASVRAVLLRGEGKHFCAGGDFAFLEENTRRPRTEVRAAMLRFYGLYLSILQLKAPSIAVVQGSAIGAGLCLALACDLRIGAISCRLGANFVGLGLHPGMGATCLVPAAVGEAHAASLLLSGRVVGGDEAAALGLLTEAVVAERLPSAARRRAEEIARRAPLAVAGTVDTLRSRKVAALPAALEREADCQAVNFGSLDVQRAIEAFRTRTEPRFAGD